jgi:peptide/nickel transport system ATP-binding protein
VVIMNRGRIVDAGAPQDILANPREDYTRELMAAIPRLGERWTEIDRIKADALARDAEPLRVRA